MKFKVSYQGHDKWVAKALAKLTPTIASSLEGVMATLKGRAQYAYLRGPYPTKLSYHTGGRTSGALRDNIQVAVTRSANEVYGIVGLPSITFYGKIWEAVDEYAHRKGATFKNGSPMARPFVRPAWEDIKKESVYTIRQALAAGLSR